MEDRIRESAQEKFSRRRIEYPSRVWQMTRLKSVNTHLSPKEAQYRREHDNEVTGIRKLIKKVTGSE
jgi:hypothetical protein